MARKSNVASLSVEALFKLRDQVAAAIGARAIELKRQLSKLAGNGTAKTRVKARKVRKVAPQSRSKKNPKLVWSGRGVTPIWMREEMKGTKLKKESFRIK
jgi:DNA-binding protein H-NS